MSKTQYLPIQFSQCSLWQTVVSLPVTYVHDQTLFAISPHVTRKSDVTGFSIFGKTISGQVSNLSALITASSFRLHGMEVRLPKLLLSSFASGMEGLHVPFLFRRLLPRIRFERLLFILLKGSSSGRFPIQILLGRLK